MIIVHDTFVCKPGNASKLAQMFKDYMKHEPASLYVMTDMTGQWHRVIMVSQFENLAAYEKNWEKLANPTEEMKKEMEKFKDMNEMYVSGSREIFKVW
jgi:quinol monooxygenase YgiN